MSEWNSKEPLVWRAAESLLIGILTVIALTVALVSVAIETVKGWINE
jgi:hypothetical protein